MRAALPAVFALLLTSLLFAGGGGSAAGANSNPSDFYKDYALFSTRPNDLTKLTQSINRFGPVGIGIELHPPAFVMKVKNVEKGSPAEATGQFKTGQFIDSINGEVLKDIDPRIQLGNIITKAEAHDGKIVLKVRDDNEATPRDVVVKIPILGSYSKTWPANCKKSDQIVRDLADHLAQREWNGRIDLNGPQMMFLLSTGEEKDLEVVRKWIKKTNFKNQGTRTYAWFVGWGATPLAEYYLRTGDEEIIPVMQEIADAVRTTMYHDAWGGRGMAGHHMGIAGTGVIEFLLLAKQCGVDVEERMFSSALEHFYRFAGRGVNPYMDAHPETSYTDNGRNGRLALAMAAAVGLDPLGEKGLYAKARDICATHSFYSNSYMLHGHTGGGIGEVWRSQAMGLLFEKLPAHYREFMDTRRWWYELNRRFDGSFGILGGGNYDQKAVSWLGPSLGLTYTAPRKKLAVFGAKSKYAKKHKIPSRPWGTAEDDDFLNLQAASDKNGKVLNLNNESLKKDTGLPMVRKYHQSSVSDQEILHDFHHPQFLTRKLASGEIYSEKRFHLIPQLLKHKDARVRYAALTAMPMPRESSRPEKRDPGFPQDQVTPEILSLLFSMLKNPNESWFVVDQVLMLLSRRPAEELVPHVDRIISFLGHKEQWLRHSALRAIAPLALHKTTHKKVFAALEKNIPNFIRAPRNLKYLVRELHGADTSVQKAAVKTLGNIYITYPGDNANPPGGLHPQSESWYLGAVAGLLESTPGGLDELYDASSHRFPEKALSHRESFLRAKDLDESPKVKKALQAIILEELIPEHIGENWPFLHSLSKREVMGRARETQLGRANAMGRLAELYGLAGVKGYEWMPHGTDRHGNEWSYHSFVASEKGPKWDDMRKNRYREISYPNGMENWMAGDFDATKAGWKKGKAPFANHDNQLPPLNEDGKSGSCTNPVCGCSDPAGSLWEHEVLLMRRTFDLPPLEDGYRYRLLVGGSSHVGAGDGFCVYVNGRKFIEQPKYGGRGSGGAPKGSSINKDFQEDFKGGQVVVAAKAFLRKNHRAKVMHGKINIWFEKQKMPPFGVDELQKSAQLIPMLAQNWQELQDPESSVTDPNEGKFRFDGKHLPNTKLLGTWEAINVAPSVEEYASDSKPDFRSAPFKQITFSEGGKTNTVERLWSGDTLMDLKRNYRGAAGYEALNMKIVDTNGEDLLFIEVGGFNKKSGSNWKPPLLVMKKK